ncbi:phage tail protein, partial [Escherichia coli]|nr:phage tail protein [Escherichia coli]
DNDTGIKQNGDGILDVYANAQHVFRFQNGALQSNRAVNVTGRVTPSDYGNFDARYQTKTGGVQDVRLGGYQQMGSTGSNLAPSGYVSVGGYCYGDWDNSADGWFIRPLQKLINGTWYNVASM